jgi:hypothetical protein
MDTFPVRINRLIDALARALPRFDPAPLHARPPEMEDGGEDVDTETIANWLYDHLRAQGLADTLEWGRFNGEKLDLEPLADLDFSSFDAFWEAAYEVAAGKVAMPWDWKFLEVMNGVLQPHDLAIMELVAREAGDCATLLCVGADTTALEELEACLAAFGLHLNPYTPMTGEAALEALRHRGEAEERVSQLASRLFRHAKPETEDEKPEDRVDRLFNGMAENLSAHIMAAYLADSPALQGEHAGLVADFLFVTLAFKPLRWLFRSIRTAAKGMLALLVLGSAMWLGLRLGGHGELASDIVRLAAWGMALLLAWCVLAICVLGAAVHRHRRKTAG